jgi:hypothetical protein
VGEAEALIVINCSSQGKPHLLDEVQTQNTKKVNEVASVCGEVKKGSRELLGEVRTRAKTKIGSAVVWLMLRE